MRRAARWVEVAVGAFFLVSAAAKAFDMEAFAVQISAYNVVKDASLVRASSWFALTVEVGLGALLVGGVRPRGMTHIASAAMILVYSTLIAYAWRYHGLTDCGCLGAWITMGPVESLVKNTALLAALGFAGLGTLKEAEVATSSRWTYGAFVPAAMILALAAGSSLLRGDTGPAPTEDRVADASRPFAQFVFETDGQSFDLGHGAYLVPLLNATCEHCQRSVPDLNRLFELPGAPEMVALMMGNERELAEFQALTAPLFATHLIDTLKFMEFIGSSPPRLVYVKDGRDAQHWDWQDDVPVAEIEAYVKSGGA